MGPIDPEAGEPLRLVALPEQLPLVCIKLWLLNTHNSQISNGLIYNFSGKGWSSVFVQADVI